MKTITYKSHVITKHFDGSYSSNTGRYGIVKESSLSVLKKMIDNSISIPY